MLFISADLKFQILFIAFISIVDEWTSKKMKNRLARFKDKNF